MKTTVLVFVDRENTSMGMRIASQEEFTQILIKNKELPLQERRLFTKDVIADTDGLDVMYIETGLPDYQKWNSKQTYRNKIQNAKRKYREEKNNLVPVWERATITLEEAAAYTGIGVRKLREMTDEPTCDYVMWVGNRRMIKRRKLDEYLENAYSV